jgi:hypothetical protein
MKRSSLKPEQSPASRLTWKKLGQVIIYAVCSFLFIFVTLQISSRLAAKEDKRPQEKTEE